MEDKGLSRMQLMIMTITAGVCVANIYYNQPILKNIGASFNAKESEVGIIAVLAQAGYGLGLFFITPLGDKIDRKKLILFLQLTLIAVLLGTSFFTNIIGIYFMSLMIGILGVAAQVIFPMAAGMDTENRGKNVGIIFTGVLIGILAARVFSGYIAEWLGWRYVYGISAGMVFITALLVKFLLPSVSSNNFKGNYSALLQSTVVQFTRFPLLRRTAILGAFVFGTFCSFWTTLTFHLSAPPFNYRSNTIGLFGLLAIGGAMLSPIFGKLADKGNSARVQILTICVQIVGVVLIKFLPNSLVPFIVAVLLLDAGVSATQVTNIATIYTLDATAHSRINTVYMTVYFIGGALGTFVGVQCWKVGGWNMVTWQLLIWEIVALLVAITGFKKQVSVN